MKTDLEIQLIDAIIQAQEELAAWIVPDSTVTDSEVLTKLLSIFDDPILVKTIREQSIINTEEKFWPDSPNIEKTTFHIAECKMELTMKDGSSYQYLHFTRECWDRLIEAESIGSFLHREVKGKFKYIRVNFGIGTFVENI